MSNNYMTEQYMTSILQQYQQNSPQKTSSQNVSQDLSAIESGEQNRRQLNESLFKSINDTFDRQISQITVDKTRMTDTPLRVQQMVRNPVITSDSFRPPVSQYNTVQNHSIRGRPPFGPQSVRSQYFGQGLPQMRGQTYKAKVIDYSNGIIEKTRDSSNPIQNLRPLSVSTSVLTERNINPMPTPTRVAQSVSALHSAISSISLKPQRPVPKPILKNCAQNMTNQMKSAFNRLAENNNNKKTVPKPKNSSLIEAKSRPERDTIINGREGLIRTFDLDKNEAFYCYYCNTYLKKVSKLEKHITTEYHKNNINKTVENSLDNPLNKRFILGQIAQNEELVSIGLTAETIFRMELDRIPPENKHFYYMNGIRLTNPGGPDSYYCRFCEQSIQSLVDIESHLSAESHRQNENRTTISKFLSQTTEPIIGLQFITEYMSPDLLQPVYECSLCKCFEDAYDMYLHICSFKHSLKLLINFNPKEAVLNSIKESPQAIKEIKKRMTYLSETVPSGAINKVRNSPNRKKVESQKRKISDFEVIDITDDDVEESPQLKKSLAIHVSTDEEAADAAILIQALKESVVKYYLNKIPAHMRRVLISKVMDDEVMDLDIRL